MNRKVQKLKPSTVYTYLNILFLFMVPGYVSREEGRTEVITGISVEGQWFLSQSKPQTMFQSLKK